jgi:hypothetical protein
MCAHFLGWRLPLAALGVAALAGGLIAGVVIPRDLPSQLKMLGDKGKVAHVTVLERSGVPAPWDNEAVLTRVKVRVVDPFWNCKRGDEFEFFSPGGVLSDGTTYTTTISPRPQLLEPGHNVVVFLARDERITAAFGESGRYLSSFAEIYDVQRGLGREPTVIGQGRGAAIEENVKIAELSQAMTTALKQLEKRGG